MVEKVCINVDSLDLVAERKGRLQLMDCYRAGNETGGYRGKGEDLQLAYLLSWPEGPVGSQEMPLDKAMSEG